MGVATMRVPTIFTAIDRFSNVVDKMTRKTTMFGQAAGAAAMRTSKKFNDAGSSLLTSGAIMGVGIGIAVDQAVKFEKAMATVSTTIDSTPEMMKRMGDDVLKLSKIIPKPLDELTSGLYDVVSAGIDAQHSMTVLKASGRLAVAGLGTTAEGVDILTSSINSFNIDASKSEEIANKVFKAVKYGKTTVEGLAESFGNSSALIKNSNIELSEFLAATASLTTTGMSASRAQTQVASATIALIKPNKTMSKILNRLGAKDIPTFIKKNGGLIKTLDLVQKMAEKTGANLPAALGRKEGLNALLSLLGPLRKNFQEIYNDMESGNDTLSASFKKQTAATAARFQLLKNNLVDLAIKVGDAVLPALNSLVEKVIPIIQGITTWSENNEWLSRTLLYATGILLSLGVAAKLVGMIFFGLGKTIQFITFVQGAYTTVTELCTVATYLAASGQATLAASLGAVAAGLLAAYWPVLLVVAALGGLAYVLSSTSSSTDDYVSKQLAGLDKSNMAWKNSTAIQKSELQKQRNQLAVEQPGFKSKFDGKSVGGILGNISKRKENQAVASKANMDRIKANFASMPKTDFAKMINTNLPERIKTAGVIDSNKPKNLAGASKYSVNDDGMQKTGGTVTINLNDPGNNVESVETDKPKGITVKTTSTKK
jgi:TP901 family phage tail tape measure protein